MHQRIAFLDFDGTITTKDTLLEFIKFSKGKFRFYLGFLLQSPWLFAFKTGIISNQAAKERVLRWFFRNTPTIRFEEYCREFTMQALPALIRPKAVREIGRLQQEGFTVVIVSASPENWIRPWADQVQAQLIATRLVTTANTLTGRILGRNCYGEEKVNRIREQFTLPEYTEIYAYGDSSGDRQMLKIANISFYQPFR